MLFRRSDVPLSSDSSGRFLPWLVAVMVYLAALAVVSAMAMNKVSERWDQGLAGRLTIQLPAQLPSQLPGGDPGKAKKKTDQIVDRIIELLVATKGVTSVEVLTDAEVAALLEPWLGAGVAAQDLPLPGLIAVAVDSDAPPEFESLRQRLAQVAPEAVLDDHQRWLGNLLSLTRSIEIVAGLVVFLVGASAIIMAVFVTRMGLAVHHNAIELLHLIGAHDSYIAGQFQYHALKLGFSGGVVGLAGAAGTVFAIGHLLRRTEAVLLPSLTLTPVEWVILASLPVLAAVITMMTARRTVLRTLAHMP